MSPIEGDRVSVRSAASVAAMLCLLASGAAAPPAGACAFDGGVSADLFGGGFEARTPQSSAVYFAIIDAVEQGVIERSAFPPIVPGPEGYWRAVSRLNSIAQRLSAGAKSSAQPGPAISVVFIESDLWARLEPGPRGFGVTPHMSGAGEGDIVVVTSEGAIGAVLDGRLPAKVALDRGLIAIDGKPAAGEALRGLMIAALGDASASATTGVREPMRLFGPAR
jgi:hypothetical protein